MSAAARAVALVAALCPGLAWAQAPCVPSERDRVESAVDQLAAQDFEGAERGLQRALSACPGDPVVAGMLGMAQVGTEHYVEAERHLVEALAYALQRRHDPQLRQHRDAYRWVERSRQSLEADLATARAHLGAIHVQAAAPGAVLTLPDERRVVLPMVEPARVVAGAFTVRVEAPGYTPEVRDVVVAPGLPTRVSVSLLRVPPPPPPPRPPPPPPVIVQRLHQPSPWRTAGWAAVGLGVASAVTAVIAWGYTESQWQQARTARVNGDDEYAAWARQWDAVGGPGDWDTVCQSARAASTVDASQVRGLCGRSETARVVAGVFAGVGVLALSAGFTMVALARDRVEERRLTPRVSASIGRGGGGVSLSVPFF